MLDLSAFVRDLKYRFSRWFNRREGRRGTLWEDRFKSVLVEGGEEALLAMAAYIDLNPVRAGMVEDPAEYRWSGYGEACAGRREARRGLGVILEAAGLAGLAGAAEGVEAGERAESAAKAGSGGSGGKPAGKPAGRITWRETGRRYRCLLYGTGEDGTGAEERPGEAVVRPEGGKDRFGFTREAVERALAAGGRLPLGMALRCRVRYFTDGAVFGTREFVDRVFEANRGRHGPDRKGGARRMRGAEWGGLRVLRDLQVDVMG